MTTYNTIDFTYRDHTLYAATTPESAEQYRCKQLSTNTLDTITSLQCSDHEQPYLVIRDRQGNSHHYQIATDPNGRTYTDLYDGYRYWSLWCESAPVQRMVIYHPEPDTTTESGPVYPTYSHRDGSTITARMTEQDAFSWCADNLPADHWLRYWVHKYVNTHLDRQTTDDMGNALEQVAHAMIYAIGQGLKRPRIRAQFNDQRFQLYVTKGGNLGIKWQDRRGTTDQDTASDLWTKSRYIGCIAGGRFIPGSTTYGSTTKIKLSDNQQEFLSRLQEDPTGFLAECGKDLGSCCYCNNPIDVPDSKEAGYGEICAKRYGLPYGKELYDEKVVTFSGLYSCSTDGPTLQAFMRTICADPYNQNHWSTLSDWLLERGVRFPKDKNTTSGLRLPKAPGKAVLLPSTGV